MQDERIEYRGFHFGHTFAGVVGRSRGSVPDGPSCGGGDTETFAAHCR